MTLLRFVFLLDSFHSVRLYLPGHAGAGKLVAEPRGLGHSPLWAASARRFPTIGTALRDYTPDFGLERCWFEQHQEASRWAFRTKISRAPGHGTTAGAIRQISQAHGRETMGWILWIDFEHPLLHSTFGRATKLQDFQVLLG